MHENTNLFGTTVCNPSKNDNSFQSFFIKKLQSKQVMFNQYDKPKDIKNILNYYFKQCKIQQIGYMTTFEATNFKYSDLQQQLL